MLRNSTKKDFFIKVVKALKGIRFSDMIRLSFNYSVIPKMLSNASIPQ